MSSFRRKLGKIKKILLQPEEKWKLVLQKKEDEEYILEWLQNYGFKSIIDIGANEGQFATRIRKLYPSVPLFSFEPIPFIYDTLRKKFEADKLFYAYNVALSDSIGTTQFYLNEYSGSSSLLKMTEHKKHFDFAINEKVIEVQLEKLDNVSLYQLQEPFLVKIDVQGTEMQVIKGGENIIKQADVIITEVSFRGLYESQALFDDIYQKMLQLGFKYAGNSLQIFSPVTGEILQADAIFINANVQ